MPETHVYRLFGLLLESEIALPELRGADRGGAPDFTIVTGSIEVPDLAANPAPIDGGAVISVAGVARYAVLGGNRIIVDPEPAAAERDVRLYLLGSAMGMLLHQRELVPLHANAIEIDGRAFAFAGHSGAGKSTLAAWFHDHGFRTMADDVCVIGLDSDQRPMATAGLPRLRLWREAIEASGRDFTAFNPSFSGDGVRDKYDVPIDHGEDSSPAPLAAIYLLEQGEQLHMEELSGIAAAEALFANTYRGSYLKLVDSAVPHWSACMALIPRLRIFRARREWGFELMDQQNAALLAHARSIIGPATR